MGSYPPGTPPGAPPPPPPGWDPRDTRRYYREQARAQRAAWRAQMAQARWQMRSLRRGSVLGPLLLIGAGIVFLLIHTGRIERHAFFAAYGRWWPLLLVAAGLVVLAEWMLDQYHMRHAERPQYRRTIGGGVIVLLLMLAFVGILAEHGPFWRGQDRWFFPGIRIDEGALDQFFGDKHEFDQAMDVDIPAGDALTIVNPRGDVTVDGTSDDGRVHIKEHKVVYARSDSEAEDRAQQLAPKAASVGGSMRLSIASIDGAHADVTMTVPPEAQITVNANHGDVHVGSIKSAVTATANHGDVDLAAITGAATVAINSGGASLTARNLGNGLTLRGHAEDITLSDVTGPVALSGDFFGTTHLEHINGEVHFHTSRTDLQLARLDGELDISGDGVTAEQVQGPVTLTTSNRNVTLERMAGDVAVTNRNGTVELTAAPGLGNITVQDRNGSIKATLPEHAGFVLSASTSNGEIQSEFSPQGSQSSGKDDETHKSLNTTVGSGGPTVHLATANGDITIGKGDVAPLSPPPPPAKITMTPPAPPAAPKPVRHAAPKPPAIQ